jgi:hypothetical protein
MGPKTSSRDLDGNQVNGNFTTKPFTQPLSLRRTAQTASDVGRPEVRRTKIHSRRRHGRGPGPPCWADRRAHAFQSVRSVAVSRLRPGVVRDRLHQRALPEHGGRRRSGACLRRPAHATRERVGALRSYPCRETRLRSPKNSRVSRNPVPGTRLKAVPSRHGVGPSFRWK